MIDQTQETQMEITNQTQSTNSEKNCWSLDGKRKLLDVATIVVDMQKAYGKEINLKSMLRGWELILSQKYTVEQIIYALGKYMEKRDDVPTPANIVEILDPPKPEITATQYIHAKEQWKLGGYSAFSDHMDIVKAYERQGTETLQEHKIQNAELLKIAQGAVKKIT